MPYIKSSLFSLRNNIILVEVIHSLVSAREASIGWHKELAHHYEEMVA